MGMQQSRLPRTRKGVSPSASSSAMRHMIVRTGTTLATAAAST